MSLSELIRSIRLCEEKKQTDFAKDLGLSSSHLCDIEKGRKLVSPLRATQFAKILGYSEIAFVRLAFQDQARFAGLEVKIDVKAA